MTFQPPRALWEAVKVSIFMGGNPSGAEAPQSRGMACVCVCVCLQRVRYLTSTGPGTYRLICANLNMWDYNYIRVSLGGVHVRSGHVPRQSRTTCLTYMVDPDVLERLTDKGPNFHHIVNKYPSLSSFGRAGVEKGY